MIVLFVHSKSNAYTNASRTRLSCSFSRRVLKNQPCAPDGVSSAITIIFIAYQIEVVLPARDRQIRAPPILDPFVLDVAAGLEASDLVGTAAQRRLERGLIKRMTAVIGARQDR